jgi:pimeloyl-ACP methyl ester carboxylesterase
VLAAVADFDKNLAGRFDVVDLHPDPHLRLRMTLPIFRTGVLPTADGAVKPYVTIGAGPIPMVVVPGAADGLRTCVEVAPYLAWFYRHRAENCRLLILSRREPLSPDFGIQRHADDMIRILDELAWEPSVWECLSAAGPIGQWIAVKRPDLVRGLILSSTYDVVGPRTLKVLRQWIDIAGHREGMEAFSSTLEKKYRPPPEILAQIDPALLPAASAARDPQRLTCILQELLELDQRDVTPRITTPTLVIGGADDKVVPAQWQQEMAARIPSSSLELCPGYGHFNDMENPAYQMLIQQFAEQLATPAPASLLSAQ